MVVNAVGTSTQVQSAADTAASKTAMDYDTFLTLLVAQLKNQDPTEPMDSTEQIAQLATFSQVEQTIQTNKSLEKLLQSSNLSQAGAIIGRTLTSADGSASGVVTEVRVLADGLTAILANGAEVAVGAGVTVR
ncbi:flagellar hook assembly protein FlgD [Pseudohoeflea coraliihabitans]|uniref:Basal-body rod modification protein FlgD n=1 Tax=Pseudohoeflea coraliihabitans TaxID=2860393 RepID=A0ABS6WQM8_9HYPH|nr:flagellar hook assembly protein FlgD [Pseudohoeflea sp. DP4N28-3]MBW3097349.1 flagellar hook assembly protein FlgD [Pseudohoeflea sp. DP4N28-3]